MSSDELPTGTAEQILDGALTALARHGRRKLSMSDVVHHAGVARGTLYRYFANKDALLAAIGDYVKQRAQANLSDAIGERPEPEHRFRVVLDVMTQYRFLQPEAAQVLTHEPEFALNFLRDVFDEWLDFITEALEPAAPHMPAVRDGSVSIRQLAELALRMGTSIYLMPSPQAQEFPVWMDALVVESEARLSTNR